MRILLVSQMYPGPGDPDLGVFVAQLEAALEERGHELERAVLDSRSGGKLRYLTLARRAVTAARRFRPDVVYAHFLVPAGFLAGVASRAPLVVTAHGRDVRNVGARPGVAALTRRTVARAAAVIAVSDYLRCELETKVPEARGKTEVIDSGVDLDRFVVEPAPEGGPHFLCLGALSERKNVVRLAEAFERLGSGTLTFVGDGPLRGQLEGRPGVEVVPSVPHDEVPGRIAARPRGLPAEPDRAVRPGAARGDGLRALGGRHPRRRPAGVRAARRRRARRPARRGGNGRCAPRRVVAALPESRRARGGGAATM